MSLKEVILLDVADLIRATIHNRLLELYRDEVITEEEFKELENTLRKRHLGESIEYK